jgi:hypothetical protein
MMILVGVSILAALNARTVAAVQQTGIAASFFSGSSGDLIGYALVAVIPLGFATAFLARLIEAGDGQLTYEALRRGSYRRWQSVLLWRELGWALVLAVAVGGVVAGVMFVAHGPPTALDVGELLRGTAGLFAETLLLTALASGLIWVTASPGNAWVVSTGLALAIGYWFPRGLPAANVLAPYSVPADGPQPAIPTVATILTFLLAAAVAVFAVARATPAHADHTL